jgi:hypothetical protein
MAEVADLVGKAGYLDTNIPSIQFHLYSRGIRAGRGARRELFSALDGRAFAAVTSEFTLAGADGQALRAGARRRRVAYISLVQNSERITVAPVDRAILIEAARPRVRLGILMPTRSMSLRR